MDLGRLFGAVTQAISTRTGPVQDVDTGGFLNEVSGMFRQHADATGQQFDDSHAQQYAQQYQNTGQYQNEEILPASMDPMGDPADQEQENILPASMDPMGDPADDPRGYGR